MPDNFGTLRSLMHRDTLNRHERQQLWHLLCHTAHHDPQRYHTQWLPYVSGFEHHQRQCLATMSSLEELKQAVEIAPFGRFGLSFGIGVLSTQDIVSLVQSPLLSVVAELELYGNDHIGTTEAMMALAHCPNLNALTWLDLTGCWLSAQACRALCTSPYLPALEILRLSDGDIQNEGVEALFHTSNLPSLSKLAIANNEIDDNGVLMLLSGRRLEHLVALDLSHNQITGQGAQAMALAIDRMPKLKALSLQDNPIIPAHLAPFHHYAETHISDWMFPD